jgi:3-hydroxyisobutyrate dehydrogenase
VNVALLGTGKMGAAIARRLAAAGHDLTIWNRTLERARAVGVGRVADTAAEAAAAADVVLSILYDAASVREVYAGLGPRRGQVYVEMSTAGTEVVDEVAALVEAGGAELLVAPILGSMPAIEQGSALILAGGDADAFERVRPVLTAFGQPELAASRREAAGLKLLGNALLHVGTLAAAELMSSARRAGLDEAATFRVLCRIMPYLQARSRGYLERSHDRPLFTLSGSVKDQGLALEMGHAHGAAMPLLALSRELYAMAEPRHGHEEMTAVIETYPR